MELTEKITAKASDWAIDLGIIGEAEIHNPHVTSDNSVLRWLNCCSRRKESAIDTVRLPVQ
jgi:hypothetical protein